MSDTTLTYLDAYCERAGDAAFWAEPLNAVTNLAFVVAAILAYQVLKRQSVPLRVNTSDVWALVVTLGIIGLGSGLWHTHATHWSMLADIIPIYIFINVYIFSLFIRLFGLKWYIAFLGWAIFQGINIGFEVIAPRDTLNGSIMYIPTYGLLLFSLGWMALKRHESCLTFANIIGLFTLSLTFRTVDIMTCTEIPIGTHFLWHTLNAIVLYRLIMLLVPSASGLHRNKNTTPAQS